MHLYLVRHGRAEDRERWDPANDHLRPLTLDGKNRLRKSTRTMKALDVLPARILTSPLTRARQTADILAEGLGCPVEETEALVYFGVGTLTDILADCTDDASLMLVGHEPDFSTVVEMVTGGGRVVVKKGSLIRLDLHSCRPPRGTLIWSIPPKALVL